MLFQVNLTVPSGTTAAAPTTYRAPVGYGTLRAYRVLFPPGCAGLVSVRVRYAERQILPEGEETAFVGSDTMYAEDSEIALHDVPYDLVVEGWAPDATYDHTIVLQFRVEQDTPQVLSVAAPIALPGV